MGDLVQKLLDVDLAVVVIVTVVFFFVVGAAVLLIVVVRLLKLAVPGLLNLVDLLLAEGHPLLGKGVLSELLLSHVAFLGVHITVLIIHGTLSQMAQFKGNLDNLTHVCGGGGVS